MNIIALRRYAASGMTLAETAAFMGRGYKYTALVASRHGIKFDRPVKHCVAGKKGAENPRCKVDRKQWTEDERRLLLDLANAGEPARALAERFGVSAGAIYMMVSTLRRKAVAA